MSKAATANGMRGDALGVLAWPLMVLRGIGQVMFQEHAGTGACFLLGIAIASLWMCLATALAALIGTLTAHALRVARQDLTAGLYGFNSALVGTALLFYLEPRAITWLLVAVGASAAAAITWLSRRLLPIAVYTAPFVVTTWICLLIVGAVAADVRRPPAPPDHTRASFAASVLAGEAEVMFGASAATGICFLLGIAISNYRHALAALAGSLLGTLTATYRHDPDTSIWIGLYGYNASLAAMAAQLARPGLLAPALAALITVPIVDWAAASWGVPALTAPFVLAAWIILLLLTVERALAGPAPNPS